MSLESCKLFSWPPRFDAVITELEPGVVFTSLKEERTYVKPPCKAWLLIKWYAHIGKFGIIYLDLVSHSIIILFIYLLFFFLFLYYCLIVPQLISPLFFVSPVFKIKTTKNQTQERNMYIEGKYQMIKVILGHLKILGIGSYVLTS